jgi:hypothetical protein
MAAPIVPDDPGFKTDAHKVLMQTRDVGLGEAGPVFFGVSPDGERLLLRVADDQPREASIVVVTNWPELLKRH